MRLLRFRIERTRRIAELITDHVVSICPYVRYRTYAAVAGLEECARDAGITDVDDMMRLSDEDLPRALSEEYDDYDEEYGESYQRMAEEARRFMAGYDQFAESLGFTPDELFDLRHSCSRYAASCWCWGLSRRHRWVAGPSTTALVEAPTSTVSGAA